MSDKRSVHTDALATLGNILVSNEKRDAIHIAVLPVFAAELLHPGQKIGILSDGRASHNGVTKYLGVVDPFLKVSVAKGEKFWFLVNPRTITSLRHVWEHPEFKE